MPTRLLHPRWIVLLLLFISLSACAGATTPAATQEPTQEATPTVAAPSGTVTLALTTKPNSLDVVEASERQARNASWPLYDSLIWIAENGTKEPALAESWDISEDGTE